MNDTIATGKLSAGGYVGPAITVEARVGFATLVVDPRYVGGVTYRVVVTHVGLSHVGLKMRNVHSHERFRPANPIPLVIR